MPANGKRGRRWNDHRRTLNSILRVMHTRSHRRELPEWYWHWKSAHDRPSRWRRDGTFDRILDRLHLRLNDRGRIDTGLWCVDATNVRARQPVSPTSPPSLSR